MERSFQIINFPKPKFIKNKHFQTILSSLFPPKNNLKTIYFYEDIYLETKDETKDILVIHHNPPLAFYKANSVPFNGYYLILIHGMEGSADSHYMVTLGEAALKAGFGIVRMNLRGCGISKRHTKKVYNASNSEDINQVVKYVYSNINHNLILCGFSLSANSILKYLGETRRKEISYFSAVSPPLDLKKTCDFIDSRKARFYRNFFLRSFKKKLKKGDIRCNPEWLQKALQAKTLFEYDNSLTAPMHGYKNALEYYEDCSSINYIYDIPQIGIIIHADDDPIIPSESFEKIQWNQIPHITPILTHGGGHVGFLTKKSADYPDGRWLNKTLLSYFIEKIGFTYKIHL